MRLHSRKFWLSVGAALLASLLLVLGHIDQDAWQWTLNGTVIAYLAAQGATDAAEKLRGK